MFDMMSMESSKAAPRAWRGHILKLNHQPTQMERVLLDVRISLSISRLLFACCWPIVTCA